MADKSYEILSIHKKYYKVFPLTSDPASVATEGTKIGKLLEFLHKEFQLQ